MENNKNSLHCILFITTYYRRFIIQCIHNGQENDSKQRKLIELWTQKPAKLANLSLENQMERSDSSISSTTSVRMKFQTKSVDSITKQ